MSEVDVAFLNAKDNTLLRKETYNQVEFQALLKASQYKIGEKEYLPGEKQYYNIDEDAFIIILTAL